MSDKDNVTIGKDMLYGGAIVVLACLIMVSVFTQGFGLVKTPPTICPVCNTTNTGNTTQPTQPAEQPLQQLTVAPGKMPVLGQASAPVTIVEFSDYQCPYCSRLCSGAEEQLKQTYVKQGKVKIYFRNFPLSFHQYSMPAAIAAECANAQGKFWEMHDKLFASQAAWSASSDAATVFKGYAVELGLNNATFTACFDGQTPAAAISADMADAQTYGVQGTPASFIIVPKAKISAKAMKDAVSALNAQYGAGALTLFENANDYTVLVPGAFPYEAFDGVLSKVTY